ncbi:hypothetical protein JIN86_08770 [Lysinibacillus sp. HST-98]|uniref:hypothetical protein n=1 Tax=Lysinibacillus sp. HST-98 TaxID=2800419 RepID=UPI0019270659|nr:hypothetical protein [Lysinibacillus sp. HST-98]MBL3729694.1 hypothetical protein [Lysinibacillus sp. HST-98]
MTVTKKKKNFWLTDSTILKLEQLANEKNLTLGGVIEHLIETLYAHETSQNQALLAEVEAMMHKHLHSILEPITEDLKRVRITGNVIDRNTQMMLEFWNHYFIITDAKQLGSTDRLKTVPFNQAEELIKNRIAHNRQKKIDQETKRALPDNQSY